jgi:hypothetical protein
MPPEMNPELEEQDVPLPGDEEDVDEEHGQGGEDAEIEAQARAQGWVPESEWDAERAERSGRRKPKSFLTAREFLEQTENSAPMMRAQLRKLTEKTVESERKLSEMHQILLDQKRMAGEATKRAVENAIAAERQKMRQAVEEGDTAKFDEAEARVNQLQQQRQQQERAPEPRQEAPQQPEINPETQRWVGQNPWFLNNPTLKQAMILEHNRVLGENPGIDQWDSLEDAAAMVKRRYPEFFTPAQQPRKGAQAVSQSTGNRPARPTGASKIAQIPKADQEVYYRQKKMFKEQGHDFTEEEFLREYNGLW